MQVNEHAGQVQQAARIPDIDRAFKDTTTTLDTRAAMKSAEKPRRPSARPAARKPLQYGAGF